MATTLEEALAIAKKQAELTDNSQDDTLTSFLEASKADCGNGNVTYRPFIAAAFLLFTTKYREIMSDRYRKGLIAAEQGVKFIDPLEPIKEYLIGLLRVQKGLDCGKEECIADCWKADKIIEDIECSCKDKLAKEKLPYYAFSAFVV